VRRLARLSAAFIDVLDVIVDLAPRNRILCRNRSRRGRAVTAAITGFCRR
jgi:hypothetical protein